MNPAVERGPLPSGKAYAAQWLVRHEAGPMSREAPRTHSVNLKVY